MGWKPGHFVVDYVLLGVVIHGLQYGELVRGDLPAFRRGDILGFPKAELLLKSQASLMSLLHQLAVFILSGKTTTVATDEIELTSPYLLVARFLTATCFRPGPYHITGQFAGWCRLRPSMAFKIQPDLYAKPTQEVYRDQSRYSSEA
ncbi:hypothetical protein F5Y08DRAFT_91371 [Xylaria arbuscula]|nr:hypothetical protein F5Y08DRAFT_91371 [Xylaria arbuscula]